jgi:DNA-binding NtrC family response regulator
MRRQRLWAAKKAILVVVKKKVLIVEDNFVEANDLQLTLQKHGYIVTGIARSAQLARDMITRETPDIVLLDIFLRGRETGIDLAAHLRQLNIAFVYLSANSNEEVLTAAKTTEPYGFIVKPFREKDLIVTLEIAQYRHEHSEERRYNSANSLIRQLETIATGGHAIEEKLLQTANILQREIPFDYLVIREDTGLLRIGFDEYQIISSAQLSAMTGPQYRESNKLSEGSFNRPQKAQLYNDEDFELITDQSFRQKALAGLFDLKSMLAFPKSFLFYSRRADVYKEDHLQLLHRIQSSLEKILQETAHVHKYLDTPEPMKTDTSTRQHFPGVVGNSHLLLNVYDQIAQVAPYATSVLILGESGTGKERVADCIHNLSPRKNRPFIKINCASLPSTLIESELFGHEKGSFTGAIDKRIGKFEQADGGTIFLDEVGDMPVDMQVKLLRVLQEKEVEPIGRRSPVKVDVRVIAATNRHLEKEVAEGRFRLDLYYRLNVFPIALPSLRERLEDLPALVGHFIHIFNGKAGKKITGVSERAMKSMLAYDWPGNVRELENLIERGVLLAKGSVIDDVLPPSSIKKQMPGTPSYSLKTIHENERDYIIEVLRKCDGKIWGPGGAAEALNVPPTTLTSKMKKLGIRKESI